MLLARLNGQLRVDSDKVLTKALQRIVREDAYLREFAREVAQPVAWLFLLACVNAHLAGSSEHGARLSPAGGVIARFARTSMGPTNDHLAESESAVRLRYGCGAASVGAKSAPTN